MLDSKLRKIINKPLDRAGQILNKANIKANHLTFIGFLSGLTAMFFISTDHLLLAVICFIFNRLCDGLDGAVARASTLSNLGGFLDIVADFIVYSGIVFSFTIRDPIVAPAATFLLFSFIGATNSFLAYAIIAAKNNISSETRGKKSFCYIGGICEGTETAITLILMCIFPLYFTHICIFYGILCWLTCVGRVYTAINDFKV